MEPKVFTSILLFISSYSPLAIIIIIKDFDFETLHRFQHPIVICSILLLIAVSIILLFVSLSFLSKGNMPVKIVGIKNRSIDLMNYTIPYILSFIGFDLSKLGDIVSFFIFMSLMLVLTITSHSVFYNPVLALLGYKLYDIEYESGGNIFETSLLCRNELRKGDHYFIRQLTRFTYLAKEKINNHEYVEG